MNPVEGTRTWSPHLSHDSLVLAVLYVPSSRLPLSSYLLHWRAILLRFPNGNLSCFPCCLVILRFLNKIIIFTLRQKLLQQVRDLNHAAVFENYLLQKPSAFIIPNIPTPLLPSTCCHLTQVHLATPSAHPIVQLSGKL